MNYIFIENDLERGKETEQSMVHQDYLQAFQVAQHQQVNKTHNLTSLGHFKTISLAKFG